MKTLKLLNQTSLFLISLCLFALIISCEKDEDVPDYVGSWEATGTILWDTLELGYKEVITFTTSTYNITGQLKNPSTNEWIDYMGFKGSMTVNENEMNITITDVGMSTFDAFTRMPTGEILYYKDSQDEFSDLLELFGIVKTFKMEYSISENNLTLKADYNGDGKYDVTETIIYTKQ